MPVLFKADTIQIMGNRKLRNFQALLLLGVLLFLQPAWGAQGPDTAPFYSAVKSFSNNGDAFEAEFKNGMRVTIEESFGVPLAAITAMISIGQPGDIQISTAAEPYQAAIETDILALGGIISPSIVSKLHIHQGWLFRRKKSSVRLKFWRNLITLPHQILVMKKLFLLSQ